MKELDLTKVLENAPKGLKLYSPVCGEVEFKGINTDSSYPIETTNTHYEYDFSSKGKYIDIEDAERMLFPSKDVRDWDKFQIPKVGAKVDFRGNLLKVLAIYSEGFTAEFINRPTCVSKFKFTENFKIIKEPKFKMSDIVMINDNLRRIISIEDSRFLTVLAINDSNPRYFDKGYKMRLATKEELRDNYCLMLDKDNNLVRWMPEKRETYYFITACAEIAGTNFQDNANLSESFNCFPTRIMAEKAAKGMCDYFKNYTPN